MPHIHDKIDFTVAIFVVQQAQVLLVHHRALDKWLPLGGHIELDEDPEQAALREVREESGLDVELLGERPPTTEPGTRALLDVWKELCPSWTVGARVEGEVAESEDVKTQAALRGKGKLSLRFRDVVLPSGQTLPLTATLISVHDTSGKTTKKTNAEGQVGLGAGMGSATGRGFGGPLKGLAIGTLSGGGYVVATNGKDVNLPARAGMLIRLDQPLSWTGTAPIPR